ncbi:MAG: cysteine desulfurase family protein [Thiolinea sp.]
MSTSPLYLDNAATTPIASEVLKEMTAYMGLDACYFNPSSSGYFGGKSASDALFGFRSAIAKYLGCKADEIIFTSGATEANNLALQGIAYANMQYGKHIITSLIEHKSILNTCKMLEKEGFSLTYLKPNADGQIELDSVRQALRADTLLVSIQHTNNETGIIQPIAQIGELLAEQGILFHVDAAQAVGKLPLNLEVLTIDLLSLSAHKFYGLKGVGCLVIRNRRGLNLRPLLYGGGQEFDLRPGTEALHQIAGMSKALQLACDSQGKDYQHVSQLKEFFLNQLKEHFALNVQGKQIYSSPYIVNFAIPNIGSDALINQLATTVALSSSSACSSGAVDPLFQTYPKLPIAN